MPDLQGEIDQVEQDRLAEEAQLAPVIAAADDARRQAELARQRGAEAQARVRALDELRAALARAEADARRYDDEAKALGPRVPPLVAARDTAAAAVRTAAAAVQDATAAQAALPALEQQLTAADATVSSARAAVDALGPEPRQVTIRIVRGEAVEIPNPAWNTWNTRYHPLAAALQRATAARDAAANAFNDRRAAAGALAAGQAAVTAADAALAARNRELAAAEAALKAATAAAAAARAERARLVASTASLAGAANDVARAQAALTAAEQEVRQHLASKPPIRPRPPLPLLQRTGRELPEDVERVDTGLLLWRERLEELTRSAHAAQQQLDQARAREASFPGIAEELQRHNAAAAAAAHESQFFAAQEAALRQQVHDGQQRARARAEARLAQLRPLHQARPADRTLIGALAADAPIALLPVRIETRFSDGHLLIRVYPDELHIDGHEPDLTADEIASGKAFWEETWKAGGNASAEETLWEQFAATFGAPRASWIAEVMRPTNAATAPIAGSSPVFPDRQARPPGWSRAPVVAALPTCWVAIGYRGGEGRLRAFTAWGKPIVEPLAAGPAPRPSTAPAPRPALPPPTADPGTGLPFGDERLRWMVDFAAAEAAGMALRVPLTPEQSAGLDRLLVLGVRGSDADKTTLPQLLHVQRFTRGARFVPQGSPTNNTSAVAVRQEGARPRLAPAPALAARANGAVAASLLGLETGVVGDLAEATAAEQQDARAMNGALWAATWGHFFGQLLTGAIPADMIPRLRVHFAEWVRARGPLPALRLGRQPYGMLPVTAIERWTPRGAAAVPGLTETDAQHVARLLVRLRRVWSRAVARVPVVGRAEDSRATREIQLVQALQMAPTSAQFGTTVVTTGQPPAQPGVALPPDAVAAATRSTLAALGVSGLQNDTAPLPGVTAASRRPGMIFAGPPVWTVAPPGNPASAPAAGEPADASLLRLLLRRAASAPPAEVAEHLEHLKTLRPALLAQLLGESLDLAAYRLDAWISSLATRRLAAMRTTQKLGTYTGAYGWVEHLSPRAPGRLVAAPDGRRKALEEDTNGGFVHAPSLSHAAAAAVLRSGYLSRGGADRDNPLAVNLSSRRVRLARTLLDGVREGQPLGVLLGYRFERALHEAGLDRYLQPFRRLASVSVSSETARALLTAERAAEAAEERHAKARDEAAVEEREYTRFADMAREVERELALTATVGTLRATVAAETSNLLRHRRAEPRTRELALPPTGRTAIIEEADDYLDRHAAWTAAHEDVAGRLATARAQLDAAVVQLHALTHGAERTPAELTAALSQLVKERDARDRNRQAQLRRAAEAEQALAAARRTHRTLMESLYAPGPGQLEPRHVVDGELLRQKFRDGLRRERIRPQGAWDVTTIPFGDTTFRVGGRSPALPPIGDPDGRKLRGVLEELDAAVDAVADATVAEGVYQMVQGNVVRSGAALQAATGTTAPPELDVVRTPRSGTAQTHRLLLVLGPPPPPSSVWPATAAQVRARAEPRLNAWAADLLGDPRRVRCRADYLHPVTGAPLAVPPLAIRIADLGLSPLDLVFMAEGDERGQQGELDARLRYYALRKLPPAVTAADVRLSFARDTSWPAPARGAAEPLSVPEFVDVLRTLRAFLSGARPLDGRDLAPPESGPADAVVIDELRTRAEAARSALGALDTAVRAAITGLGSPDLATRQRVDLEKLRDALLRMAAFGIVGAVPRAPRGSDDGVRGVLREQAAAAAAESGRRLASAAQRAAASDWTGVMRALFGDDFRVLPQVAPRNRADITASLADATALYGGDAQAVLRWTQRAARVREGVSRFHQTMTYAEAIAGAAALDVKVAQLPHAAGARWIALPFDKRPPAAAQLSLVLHMPRAIAADQSFAGLLIDEWVEVVPNARETTALAFHHDEPNARAPQAILLAVPPDASTTWTVDALEATLLETLELMKIRAVDGAAFADHLARHAPVEQSADINAIAVAQLLPAIYVDGGTTVATTPTPQPATPPTTPSTTPVTPGTPASSTPPGASSTSVRRSGSAYGNMQSGIGGKQI